MLLLPAVCHMMQVAGVQVDRVVLHAGGAAVLVLGQTGFLLISTACRLLPLASVVLVCSRSSA
jgi:hypothetical protein